MATSAGIGWQGIFVRFVLALILVFATYNPDGLSYSHWVKDNPTDWTPLKVLAGVILVIGWTVYVRATLRSLGPFGLVLAAGFFGAIVWLIVDVGLVKADSTKIITYLVLIVLSGILTTGMAWSHIRRRISGQVDVDEIEED